MAGATRVTGLRELVKAFELADKDMARGLKRELSGVGEIVRADATSRFATIDERSAHGFRSRVRGFGTLVVEQMRRRTTGQHPEFGSLQMRRALLPARSAHTDEVVHRLERLLDTVGTASGF